MTSTDAVKRFKELLQPYPNAAAGLLKDLCSALGRTVYQDSNDDSFESQVTTIRECFQIMDAGWPPDCHAWDQITFDLSRWLNQSSPRLQQAVGEITGWSDDRLAELKELYPGVIRELRDEYNKVLAGLSGS